MNSSRLMNMVVRMILRRVVSRGVNAGIDRVTRGQDASRDRGNGQEAGANRDTARLAKQAMRLGRRVGRF